MPDYPAGWVVDKTTSVWIPSADGKNVRQSFVNDNFLTPQNPVVSPRICEPGPGTLDIFTNMLGDGSAAWVDCDQKLHMIGPTPAVWRDMYLYTANSFVRTEGLAFSHNLYSPALISNTIQGFSTSQDSSFTSLSGRGLYTAASLIYAITASGATPNPIASVSADIEYIQTVVLREQGNHILIKGGAFVDWTLLWVENNGVDSPLYPGIQVFRTDGYIDDWDVSLIDPIQPVSVDTFDRPDNANIGNNCEGVDWITSGTWNIINERLVGPATNASSAWFDAGVTDGLIKVICKAPAGSISILVRRQDSNNYILVTLTISTQLFIIREYVGGAPTTIDSITSTQIVADTDMEVSIIIDGADISAFINGVDKIGDVLTTILTGTEYGVQKDTTANIEFDDFYIWPRTLETL